MITRFNSAGGVFLSLQGIYIVNNSYVDIDNIGEGDNAALLCHTNKTDCCGGYYRSHYSYRAGEWYFPCTQDMKVDILGNTARNDTFYRNRGLSTVRLNRRGSPSERGCFRCEVPDANNIIQLVFVNIGMYVLASAYCDDINNAFLNSVDNVLVIFPSGPTTKTAGEVFSLVCSTDVYSLSDGPQPIFEWFFGPTSNSSLPSGITISNVTKSGNTCTSTLQFSPLYEIHAGMYTCRIGYKAVNTTISVEGKDLLYISRCLTHL